MANLGLWVDLSGLQHVASCLGRLFAGRTGLSDTLFRKHGFRYAWVDCRIFNIYIVDQPTVHVIV